MDDQASQDLIARWRAGDERAVKDLLPPLYEELRSVARTWLSRELQNLDAS